MPTQKRLCRKKKADYSPRRCVYLLDCVCRQKKKRREIARPSYLRERHSGGCIGRPFVCGQERKERGIDVFGILAGVARERKKAPGRGRAVVSSKLFNWIFSAGTGDFFFLSNGSGATESARALIYLLGEVSFILSLSLFFFLINNTK